MVVKCHFCAASSRPRQGAFPIEELEENLTKESSTRKDLEEQLAKLIAEKNELFAQLQSEKGSLGETEEAVQRLTSQKNDLEKQLAVSSTRLLLCKCRVAHIWYSSSPVHLWDTAPVKKSLLFRT